MTAMHARRRGAALIMAVLTIIVLDCVLLATLHLALQENRIAANRATILQLQLTADGGIRHALSFWSMALDTMPAGDATRIQVPAPVTPGAAVHVERLAEHLFLFESVASESAPRIGRASSRLLARPPAIPPAADPAAAAASSASTVVVTSSGSVDAAATDSCSLAPGVSIAAPPFAIAADPAARITGSTGTTHPDALVHSVPRLLALASPRYVTAGDSTIASGSRVAVISRGNLTVTGTLTGILIAAGSITIQSGAAVHGAVHAAGAITIAGAVTRDPCAVAAAVRSARLTRPRPAPGRAWLPTF